MSNNNRGHSVREWFFKEKKETKLLFHSIPAAVVALFVLSVVTMNLLANKTIYQGTYLAIDGGILVSWLSFLCMDMITKHFGPKASTRITIFAMLVNLLTCLIFYIVSIIPTPNTDYSAFNTIIGGTWFILLSSTVAFLASGLLNIWSNWFLGRIFKKNPDGKLAFFCRAYISTFIGQFVDNLVFAVLTFMVFAPIFWDGFSWTFVQCVMCSLLGAGVELMFEIFFSPLGYLVVKKWKKDNIGEDYINFINNSEVQTNE